MDFRIALLSNVNVSPMARALQAEGVACWEPPGYGMVFEPLLNEELGFYAFDPTDVLLVIDLAVLLENSRSFSEATSVIDAWFNRIKGVLRSDRSFYIVDGVCRNEPYRSDRKRIPARDIEAVWNARLEELTESSENVFVFPYSQIAFSMGLGTFFSEQMWYLARMPHTSRAQSALIDEVMCIAAKHTPHKVIAVDLDNTIWGGVVGEKGPLGVDLSDEHIGLAYKDVQRVLKSMVDAGVVLCVVSKNNFDDAIEVFQKNPAMILTEDDVTEFKVNWERKDLNLMALSEDLNLGIDSFVFLDDNPTERALVEEMLPDVKVLSFPSDITKLPDLLRQTYEELFKQQKLTGEDRNKTKQYQANAVRAEFERASDSFEDYLSGLEIVVRSVDPLEHIERIAQLIGKTNQFNLTTKRYELNEIREMVIDDDYEVYAFNVADRFGDSGLTAVAIVEFAEVPIIDTFLMSCRVMGKEIERSIIQFIEFQMYEKGYKELVGVYRPTAKNKPVEKLYEKMGYALLGGALPDEVRYRIDLKERPVRPLYTKGLFE